MTSLLITTFIALFFTRVLAGLGYRLGLADAPDGRKLHQGTIPLTGGIAIFLTMLFSVYFLPIPPRVNFGPMTVVATLVFVLGVWDDIRHINPWLRLAFQFGLGALMATFGGVAIHNVGNLLGMGDIPLLLLTVPLTALAVAGLSNAYNMIDGIDGLAASCMILPLLVLYILALEAGHPLASYLQLMLIPLAVFLLFNLGPDNRLLPKVFLGDGGSLTLGLVVTAMLVVLSQGEQALILPVTALWLVTVPLMDMLATMLRRAKHGRPLMQADRFHLHHTLMDMGFSQRQVLLLLVSYATGCAVIGLVLEILPEYLSLLCYFLLFLGHCAFVIRSANIAPWVKRLLGARKSADCKQA
jgi:UDP-GlcNAc:undecaprenyl-phosphate GlcNAc-1-phosphate transferase